MCICVCECVCLCVCFHIERESMCIIERLYQPLPHVAADSNDDGFHGIMRDPKRKFQITILWNAPNINVNKQCIYVTYIMKAYGKWYKVISRQWYVFVTNKQN